MNRLKDWVLAAALAMTLAFPVLAGAQAARRQPPTEVRELVRSPLPAGDPVTDVSLADLHDFFKHPVKSFLRSRLDISTPYSPDEARDDIPITLDALEKWDVGDRMLALLRMRARVSFFPSRKAVRASGPSRGVPPFSDMCVASP